MTDNRSSAATEQPRGMEPILNSLMQATLDVTTTSRPALRKRFEEILRGQVRDPAQAERDPKREWISPVKTVGDLVNNLLGLDQNNEIYGAYHLDLGGRKECKTRGLSLSRERVLHNGRIDDKDPNWALTGYSTIIWSAPDPRWDCGITLQAKRPGIDRWFDVHPDEVELLCNDGCFIRALAAQPPAAPVELEPGFLKEKTIFPPPRSSAVTAGGLLSCPLCRSTQLRRGVTYGYGSSEKRDAVMCLDCGCRATEAAWQGRDAVPQVAWQPIATAPKDGTQIIGWWSKSQVFEIVDWCEGRWTNLDNDEISQPTHWMPVPTPPVSRPEHRAPTSSAPDASAPAQRPRE
jgi:hypothetical protein